MEKANSSLVKFYTFPTLLFIFNPTIMIKLFLSLAVLVILACNSSTPSADDTKQGTDNAVTKAYTWTDEEEKEFLAGCVDNAKTSVSDTAAYAHCKCVLDQLKQAFPNMDSASAIIMDTAKAAAYVAKCK